MLLPLPWSRLALLWKSGPAPRAQSVRPELEGLEDRCLLAPVSLPTLPDAPTGQARHGLPHPEKRLGARPERQLSANLDSLWEAARGGQYRQPGAGELRRVEQLFLHTLLLNGSLNSLRSAWQRLNFDLLPVVSGGQTFLVLRESAEHKTGRGFYVFRPGNVPGIALQAPHGTDDAFTGVIALSLFREGPIQAGAWNTVGRSSGGKNATDLAHLEASYFQAFTRAFALVNPRGILLQLHGFESDNRTTEAALNADLIVSNGTFAPAAWVVRIARLLKQDLSPNVKLFPRDVSELGGTTNAQSKLLQGLGHDGFLHVEARAEFRELLRDHASLRAILLNNLLAAYLERQR